MSFCSGSETERGAHTYIQSWPLFLLFEVHERIAESIFRRNLSHSRTGGNRSNFECVLSLNCTRLCENRSIRLGNSHALYLYRILSEGSFRRILFPPGKKGSPKTFLQIVFDFSWRNSFFPSRVRDCNLPIWEKSSAGKPTVVTRRWLQEMRITISSLSIKVLPILLTVLQQQWYYTMLLG